MGVVLFFNSKIVCSMEKLSCLVVSGQVETTLMDLLWIFLLMTCNLHSYQMQKTPRCCIRSGHASRGSGSPVYVRFCVAESSQCFQHC